MYESDCTSLLTPSPCAKRIDGIACSDSSSYWLDDVEGLIIILTEYFLVWSLSISFCANSACLELAGPAQLPANKLRSARYQVLTLPRLYSLSYLPLWSMCAVVFGLPLACLVSERFRQSFSSSLIFAWLVAASSDKLRCQCELRRLVTRCRYQ